MTSDLLNQIRLAEPFGLANQVYQLTFGKKMECLQVQNK